MSDITHVPGMDEGAARAAALAFIVECQRAAGVSSSTELARKAGLAPSTVNKFLKNPKTASIPTTRTLAALAAAAGVELPRIQDTVDGDDRLPATVVIHVPLIDDAEGLIIADQKAASIPKRSRTTVPFSYDKTSLVALPNEDARIDLIAPPSSSLIIDISERTLEPGRPYAVRQGSKLHIGVYRSDPGRLEPYSSERGHPTVFLTIEAKVLGCIVGSSHRTGRY